MSKLLAGFGRSDPLLPVDGGGNPPKSRSQMPAEGRPVSRPLRPTVSGLWCEPFSAALILQVRGGKEEEGASSCPKFQVLGHRSIPGLFSTTAAGPSHAHAGSCLLTTQRLGLIKKIPQTQTAEAALLFRVKIKPFQNFALCLLSFQELLAIAKSMWLAQGSSIAQLRRHAEVSKEGRAQGHKEAEATRLLAPARLVAPPLS